MNTILQLRETWFRFSGDGYAKHRLELIMALTEEAMKFAGLWGETYKKGEPDSRIARIVTDEEWDNVACDLYEVATNRAGSLSSSSGSEELRRHLAEALPVLVAENVEAKRKALQAERDRVQRDLDALDEAIISQEATE